MCVSPYLLEPQGKVEGNQVPQVQRIGGRPAPCALGRQAPRLLGQRVPAHTVSCLFGWLYDKVRETT